MWALNCEQMYTVRELFYHISMALWFIEWEGFYSILSQICPALKPAENRSEK